MPALLHFTVGLLMLFYCTYQVSGESCRAQCGQKLQNCSCHASCLNLGNCCTDYPKLCVHISPHSGTLMGGKDFIVLDATCDKAQDVICRFDNETDTRGYVSESGVHCISPLVFQTGRIPFALLCNGETSSLFSGTWLAVHHSKVSDDEKSKLSNSQKWQYYGTPGHNGSLTMTWTAGTLQTQHVSIEVWGYNETGVPYSESSEAHWTYLYTLETALPNNGSFTFTPVPAPSPYDQWEVGMLRIRANTGDEGERNVHAIWSPVHALAWHLSENFRQNPADWATNKCIAWKNLENFNLPNFQNEVADCPCTLQQSRADTGRYHTDYGCNIEKGSVCTYHQGAVHCVRSIQASPQFAAGQQCCYDASGALVLTTDSIGGSTPDRGHDWGSPPYKKPPRIPGFSHWLYDVITFYYCCLWSDNCQYYLELRPSSDCRTYKPPKVASAFGEPHIITFDGLNYTFKGKGEYYLVKSTNQSLIIQCRTKPYQANAGPLSDPVHTGNVIATIKEDRSRHLRSLPDQMNVSSISSVAMQEDNSDVVEVRLKNGTQNELETLVNGEALSFEEQTWMDVKGVFLFSPITSNVTVMFPSGAGVEVRAKNEFLSINVLLPEIFQNKTQGLLGIMNGDLEDDFTLMSGIQLPSSADPPQILKFGANWAVTEESSLFLYDSQELIDDYKLKHDPMFVPIFDFDEHKNTTLTEAANMLCGDDRFCKFDVLTTNSLEIGNATKISYDYHRALVNSLQPVVLCGRLAPPANGTKNGTNYLLGSTITLSCNKGFLLTGSTQRTCQANGHWSGEPTTCIPVSHNSCAGQCGQVLPECSCRATCEKLSNCCPDYAYSCVRISPDSGLLMGGRDFVILTTIFNTSSVVKCRFNKEIVVNGSVDVYGRAHCVSPLLYETGRIPFEVSVDGGSTYPHSGTWLSVHPGKVSESEKCTLVNETKWQYYGTPHYGGSLTVHWNPDMLKTDLVDIEVWGYTESGEPYTATWSPSWKYLYTLVHKHLNNGDFTFIPKPAAAEHRVFEFGSLRIVPSKYDDGEWNIHSIWSVDHAMAWHLGEDFRKDSAGWARDKCLKWHASDKKLPDFLSEIIDCPCTQAQSRADMGRFHPDYGCDIDSGSVCTYHQGAKHCVRAIYGSPKYAAGQQCCYDERGIQVLTSDSVGGSTPDRGHDWGSPPYRKPPRVPGFSHWLYDVITFYYCCLWSHNCQYYLELRPSSDCRTYKPPKIASAFGDPHFITFDGVNYTFKGKGEYILISSNKSLVIQGRTQIVKYANGSASTVAGFSSVAMQEGSSDIIEVRLTEDLVKVEVLLNHEPLSFNRTWIDLKGAFLFYGADKRVTAMFSSGAGVEVSGRGRFLSINVLLPEEFMNQTQGLMGVMNNNPNDDFTLRDGRVLLTNLTSEELFQFGADWAVTNDGSLFTYDSTWLIDNYQVKHDPNFFPTFSVQENPSDPITEDMKIICGNDSFCRFDVLTTRDLDVGIATLMSHANYKNLSQSLQPVVSCGWLETPKNGKKEGTCYLYNYEVIFTCNTGYILVGSYSRKCQADGTWSGQSSHCVSDNTLGIVLGCVFGFLTLLILLILIALHEKKHSKKKEMNVPSVSFHQIKDA